MAFRKEDGSFLTPEHIQAMIENLDHHQIVGSLVEFVHFNPAKSENMNIFALNPSDAHDMSAKMFDGTRWVVHNKIDVAAAVAANQTDFIMKSIDTSPGMVDEDKRHKYAQLHKTVQMNMNIPRVLCNQRCA